MIESFKAKHFVIEELVPEVVFDDRGEKAWQLIDHRLIANLNSLREQVGAPMTCNNWHLGGPGRKRTQSGLRVVGQPYHKIYSQHSFGRAVDLICSVPANEIRQRIKDKKIILPHPATFEEGVSWLHMDVRNNDQHTYFFKP